MEASSSTESASPGMIYKGAHTPSQGQPKATDRVATRLAPQRRHPLRVSPRCQTHQRRVVGSDSPPVPSSGKGVQPAPSARSRSAAADKPPSRAAPRRLPFRDVHTQASVHPGRNLSSPHHDSSNTSSAASNAFWGAKSIARDQEKRPRTHHSRVVGAGGRAAMPFPSNRVAGINPVYRKPHTAS